MHGATDKLIVTAIGKLTNIARASQYFSIWIRPVAPTQALFALRAAMFEYDKLIANGLEANELDPLKDFSASCRRELLVMSSGA